MMLYKATIEMKTFDEPVEVYAKEVDMNHLPLVYIKNIVKEPPVSSIIETPDSAISEAFVGTKTLMLPYNRIIAIEELEKDEAERKLKSISGDTEVNNVTEIKRSE